MSSFVPMSLCSQSLHAQIAVPVLSLLLCATLAPAQSTATPPGIRVPALGQMHLCFSRDGSLLRILGDSSSDAGKSGHVQAIAYSVKTGAVVHLVNLQPHVQVLSVTSDGRTAVVLTGMSGDGGSHLALLDTETGRLQPIPESWYEADYPDASISGDGRLVAVYSEPAVVTDRPMTVSVYDWAGKTLVATRTSEYVSAGGAQRGGITEDGEVEFDSRGSKVVDLKTGRAMGVFGPATVRSPDGAWVVEFPNFDWADDSASKDVLVKSGRNGRTIGKLNLHVPEDQVNGSTFAGVFCGATGRFVVTSPGAVAAYTIPSGELLATFPAPTWQDAASADSGFAVVACSPAGTRVAILSGTRLTFHHLP